MKQYETRRQVADRTGVSERSLEKFAQQGGGPVMVKLGRRVLYETDAVDRWLVQYRVTSTSAATVRAASAAAPRQNEQPGVLPDPRELDGVEAGLFQAFPTLPQPLRRIVAFFLASPATSSDACLLLAEAIDQANNPFGKSNLSGVTRGGLAALASHVRDQAPRFARRAP